MCKNLIPPLSLSLCLCLLRLLWGRKGERETGRKGKNFGFKTHRQLRGRAEPVRVCARERARVLCLGAVFSFHNCALFPLEEKQNQRKFWLNLGLNSLFPRNKNHGRIFDSGYVYIHQAERDDHSRKKNLYSGVLYVGLALAGMRVGWRPRLCICRQ